MESGTKILPEYKAFWRYSDLHFCRKRLNRWLYLNTVYYATRCQSKNRYISDPKNHLPDKAIDEAWIAYNESKAKKVTQEEIKKQADLKIKQTHTTLQTVDSYLQNFGFDIAMDLGDIQLALTKTDIKDKKFSVGFGGQKIAV